MTSSTSVAKNTFYLTGAYILQKVLTFFYFAMVARTFMPEGQGMYSTALSFTALFGVFIDLGFASVLTRETTRTPERAGQFLGQALSLRLVLGVLMYFVIIGTSHALQHPPLMRELIYFSGAATFFDVLSISCWAIMRGFHRIQYEAISVLLVTVIMVGLGSIAIYMHLSIHYLVGAIVLSSFVNFIYALTTVLIKTKVKPIFGFNRALLKSLFALSIPFAIAAVFSRIYTNIDVIMLQKISGETAAGIYTSANKIMLALQFVPASISAVIFPAMSAYFVNAKDMLSKTYSRATWYLLVFALPAAVGIAVLAQKFVLVAYEKEYIASVIPLQILSIALVSAFMMFPLGALMAAVNRQKTSTIICGFAALINVVGNLLMIPIYGVVGAAIISSITYTFISAASLWYTREYVAPQWKFLLKKTMLVSIASAIMAAVLFVVENHVHLLVSVLIGATVYAVLVHLFKAFTINDARALVRAISHKESITDV